MNTTSTIKKLTLDMLPVFLAVFLAYQVNEYRDFRKEQDNLEQAVVGIRLEMKSNKAVVDTSANYHSDMLKKLDHIKRIKDSVGSVHYISFMQFLREVSPKKRNLVLPQLSDISFDAAKRKDAISSMDYETIKKVSLVYENMEEGIGNTQKRLLQAISDPDIIALKDFDRTFILLYGSLHELHAQERYLSKQIDNSLEHLANVFPE